jgi:hypothetical protein
MRPVKEDAVIVLGLPWWPTAFPPGLHKRMGYRGGFGKMSGGKSGGVEIVGES